MDNAFSSILIHPTQHVADAGVDAQVGLGVAGGGVAVDDGQVAAAEVVQQPCRRTHSAARRRPTPRAPIVLAAILQKLYMPIICP